MLFAYTRCTLLGKLHLAIKCCCFSQHLHQSAAATWPSEFPTSKVASETSGMIQTAYLSQDILYDLCCEQPVCLRMRVCTSPHSIHMHVWLCGMNACAFLRVPSCVLVSKYEKSGSSDLPVWGHARTLLASHCAVRPHRVLGLRTDAPWKAEQVKLSVWGMDWWRRSKESNGW